MIIIIDVYMVFCYYILGQKAGFAPAFLIFKEL